MAQNDFFEAQIPITIMAGRVDAQLDQVRRKVESSADKLQRKLATVGLSMSTAFTAPILIGARKIFKITTDMEDAFIGVEKTVDGTTAQMSQLRTQLEKISTVAPQTAVELFNIAEAAGQLGVGIEDIAKFTKVIADLGEASDIVGEQGAKQIARFLKITGSSLDTVDQFGAALVGLGQDAAASESEILTLGLRIGGAGKAAGLSDANILGLSSALVSLGLPAEAAGTSISKFLNKLTRAVSVGGDELKQFVALTRLSVEEFSDLFENDATQALEQIVAGISELNSAQLGQFQESLGLTDTRMTRVLQALQGNTKLLVDAFDLANTSYTENIALLKEVEIRYASTTSKIQIMINKATLVASVLGKDLVGAFHVLTPTMDRAIGSISELVGWFVSLPSSVKLSTGLFIGLVAVIGPLLAVFAGLMFFLGTGAGSITVGFIAVAATIAALIPLFVELASRIKIFSGSTLSTQQTWADDMVFTFKILGGAFKEFAKNYGLDLEKLGDKFGPVGDKVKVWWRQMKEGFSILTGTETFAPGTTAADSTNRGVFGGLQDRLEATANKQKDLADAAAETTKQLAAERLAALQLKTGIDNLRISMESFAQRIDPKRGLAAAMQQIQEFATTFPDDFDQRLQEMGVAEVWEAFEAAGLTAFQNLDPVLGDLEQRFRDMLSQAQVQSLQDSLGRDAISENEQLVSESVADRNEAMGLRFQAKPEEDLERRILRIQQLFASFSKILDDDVREILAGKLWEEFGDAGVEAIQKIIAILRELDPTMAKVFEEGLDKSKREKMIERIENVQSAIGRIGSALQGLPDKFSFMAKAAQIGFALVGIAAGLASGDIVKVITNTIALGSAFGGMGGVAEKELTGIAKLFDELGDKIEDWGEQLTETLVDFVKTGKLTFKELVDSILEDILRISIQTAITDPITRLLGSKSLASSTAFGTGAFARSDEKNGSTIQIFDQRGANAAPIEVEKTSGADGVNAFRIVIKDSIEALVRGGDLDVPFAQHFGLAPQGRTV